MEPKLGVLVCLHDSRSTNAYLLRATSSARGLVGNAAMQNVAVPRPWLQGLNNLACKAFYSYLSRQKWLMVTSASQNDRAIGNSFREMTYVAELSEASPGRAEQQAQLAVPADGAPRVGDRRRPGRMDAVSPELVPLLRGQAGAQVVPLSAHLPELEASESDEEARRTGMGLVIALPLGIAMWAAIGLTFRWAFSL